MSSLFSDEGRAKLRAAIAMWIGAQDSKAHIVGPAGGALRIQDVSADLILIMCGPAVARGDLGVQHEGVLNVDDLVDMIDEALQGMIKP